MRNTFLVFSVAEQLFALRAGCVHEIVHLAAMTQIPGQPPVLHGFVNLHGQAIPVVSVHELLGRRHSEAGLYAPMIIVRSLSPFALLADTVDDVVEVDTSALRPLEADASFNDCAEGEFTSPSGSVIVLSPERLLLAKERQCISALQAQVERRQADTEGALG